MGGVGCRCRGGLGVGLRRLVATVSLDTDTQNVFNINNLSTDANFNFINLLHHNNDNVTQDNYFNACSDSPYDSMSFNCSYSSPIDYKAKHNDNELTIQSAQ